MNDRFSKWILASLPLFAGLLGAQTLAISPINESVGLGRTKQYSVTGAGTSMVTWSVAGTPGGDMVNGQISSAGLYTAPAAIPGQNPVTITATAGGMTASTYLNVLTIGPPTTAVSPNPIPVGTYNLIVTGSGFQPGAVVWNGMTQLTTTYVGPTQLKANGYQGTTQTGMIRVMNPGSLFGTALMVPFTNSSGGGGGGSQAVTVAPASTTVVLGATQQFTASVSGAVWQASAGSISSTGLFTAPAAMPASSVVTITATSAGSSGQATVTLISNTPPTIQTVSANPFPLGVFSTSVTGTGFLPQSVAQLNGVALSTSYVSPTQLTVAGFAGQTGQSNLTVANGPVVSLPFPVQVGVANPMVSPAAARRFLEQAAFGPTPTDAAHVQSIGFQAWLSEQFNMPKISNYNGLGSQSGMPTRFLTNAVTNSDQLRQRVAFALSQIFVTSISKIIWNSNMIPFQDMLMNDAFTNYRQILYDVTLSPTMGQYLDMANNAKANPSAGTVANENYAREVLQLFSLGTSQLNPDGTVQVDGTGTPVPAYTQMNITEMARVFTGWTYAPAPGQPVIWGAYVNMNGPMVPYAPMHDIGAKTLLNGVTLPANQSAQMDINAAIDNIFNHSNVPFFFSKQLIQHLVKSNPSLGYVQRVAAVFANPSNRGDMQAVITAILTDQEARANDAGGMDQTTDGHLQEPALFIAGMVRAFGGQMNDQNYYAYDLLNMGQDIYNAPSVFNYYSPNYHVPGFGITGGEFQIYTPNSAIVRDNDVAGLFSQYSNTVQTYGPGTTVDLTPYVPLASNPSLLADALDLTLTHGTMPQTMKQTLITAITNDGGSNLHKVESGIYLILTSSHYNVWH